MAKKDKKTMDLPEVSDIPGQENIKPLRLGELADTTASSADEEGDDILEDDDDLGLSNKGNNVSREERRDLARSARGEDGTEDDVLDEAALDSTDDDGDPLNEGSFGRERSGDDLDVPGAEDDGFDEELGEEDEENEEYSLTKNDEDHDDLERDAQD
jgi:hypothetical protein